MFGRRSAPVDPDETTVEEIVEVDGAQQAKGRATPKRRDAEAARKKRMAPPRNKKEAAALRKDRMREARTKQREAMAGKGDTRYLPVRDQGPVKKYIRDYVDSRHTIGEFLIPGFIVLFFLGMLFAEYANYTPILWLLVLVVLAGDSIRVLLGVRKGIVERFGKEETRGIAMYTLMRSWQMRRLRLPKATVKPGDAIE